MTAMQVTATQQGDTFNGLLLRVKVLTAVAAVQTGATGSYSSGTGPARVSVTTTVTGSRVYGAVMDAISPGGSFTAQAGCTLLDNHADATNGNQYGTFQTTSPTGTPGATLVGTSAPTTGPPFFFNCAALEVLPDGTIDEDLSAPAAVVTDSGITIQTASFDPPPGSLLVALVSSDGGGSAGGTGMSVSGGGIGWTEVALANSNGCYCGVWTAVAGSPPVDDPPITITQTGSTFVGMTCRIKVLTGAAPSAAQTGATAAQSAIGAHQASITTTTAGSIVYGGYGSNSLTAPTAAAGTTLLDSFVDNTNGNYYGTCRATAATGTPGAATLGISAPSAAGGVGLAEILPATPGGTITEDASSPASVSTTSAITEIVNVSPPFGSLLVLMIGSDSNTGIVGMTVSGGGYNWRPLVEAHTADNMYGGVWVADVPGPPPIPVRQRLGRHAGRGRRSLKYRRQEPWPAPSAGAAVIDSTGSSPAGASAVTALATQDAGTLTTAAAAGSAAAKATQQVIAAAAGAGSVTAAGAVVVTGTAAGAGAGAASAVATQVTPASAAGAGSVTDVATQAATAAAAGAGAVTAKAVQAATGSAAGAGAVTDVATQIAPAAAAGAGAVTAAGAVSGSSTASAAGAGSVSAVVTQIAPATAAGAVVVTATAAQAAQASGAGSGSAGPAPVTEIAPAAAAGAGAVADVATQAVIASAAGAGSVTAAGSVTGAGATANVTGASAVTAVATQIAPAAAAGAASVADVATQIAKATSAGAGSAVAAGAVTGTANVAGAGAVTAKAAQAVPASAAGTSALSALATQRATAAVAGAGSATAAGGIQVAFTVGALTASTAPTAALTANGAAVGVLTAAAATATLTASVAASGTVAYPAVYGAVYGPLEGTLTASDTRTGGPS